MSEEGKLGGMVEREEVDVQPHKSLMPKLGLGGYSIPQAIAELVDNAIDARIDGKPLHVQVSLDVHEQSITVTDDGMGMDMPTLKRALRLADSEKKDKLGMFGMGLKTACSFLGEHFDVTSSPANHELKYHMWFDESEWLKQPSRWKLLLEKERKKDPRMHGTEVKIRQLKREIRGLVTRLRSDLAQRYAPYIQFGDVEIKVNRKKCSYTKPDLLEGTRKDFEVDVRGDRIHGWYGLLKQGSQRGLYGFHTFRRGRMITIYDKIGIPEHPTSARITGQIHLNHVPVTYDKREFDKESREYREAEEALTEEFKELVRQARRAAVPDRLTKRVKERLDAWKDWVQEALKSPELAGYRLPAGVTFEPVSLYEVPTATPRDVDVELRAPPMESIGQPTERKNEQERTPKEIHPARRNTVRIKGKRFEYIHEFRTLGLESPWKEFSVDEDRRLIEIFTNTDFPSYHTTGDIVFYAIIHIAESLAEIMVSRSGEAKEKVNEVREAILRASSKIANRVVAQQAV